MGFGGWGQNGVWAFLDRFRSISIHSEIWSDFRPPAPEASLEPHFGQNVHLAVFLGFSAIKQPKAANVDPVWTKNGFPKVPFAAPKMLARCIFGHKNALCLPVSPIVFVDCRGGRVAPA